MPQLDGRPSVAIEALAPRELGLFLPRHLVDDLGGNPVPGHDIVVENAYAAGCDCTHRQLAVAGQAELPHQEHIERRFERSCDFVRNRHAAAGQRQHDHVAPPAVVIEPQRQLGSGMAAVLIGPPLIAK